VAQCRNRLRRQPIASNEWMRGIVTKGRRRFRRETSMSARSGLSSSAVGLTRGRLAYANLGVIAMRRKEWDRAIALLRKAEKLEPRMAGIRPEHCLG